MSRSRRAPAHAREKGRAGVAAGCVALAVADSVAGLSRIRPRRTVARLNSSSRLNPAQSGHRPASQAAPGICGRRVRVPRLASRRTRRAGITTCSSTERVQATSILSSSARRTLRCGRGRTAPWVAWTAASGCGIRPSDRSRPRISARVAHIPTSLLWRMQNGELDGYQAKLVVLHGVGVTGISGGQPIGNIGDLPIGDRQAEFVAGYARLIAEIRARQPQAKILILPPFPRGRLRREQWRTVADANAVAYRKLADDSTVFARYRQDVSFLSLRRPACGRDPGPAFRTDFVRPSRRQHFVGPRPDVRIELRDLLVVE